MSGKSKLLWRCRRGVKELDVVLTRYLEKNYDAASQAEKQAFEKLLEYEDPTLLRFILSQEQPEDLQIANIVEKIRS